MLVRYFWRKAYLVFWLAFFSTGAIAQDEPLVCFSSVDHASGLSRGGEPVRVSGLVPLVSSPIEGSLKLHFDAADCCSSWTSPTGDLSILAGPFDPTNGHLYIWGFFANGWIEVEQVGDVWLFGEQGRIRPLLYGGQTSQDNVSHIKRSAALGMQFYSGYTRPHWLTGTQSYRVYSVAGPDVLRIRALEIEGYSYVGDLLASGLAVFAAQRRQPEGWPLETLIFFDGSQRVEAPKSFPPMINRCD